MVLSGTRKRHDGRCFCKKWNKLSRGESCARESNPIIPSRGMGARRWEWSGCCGFIFCSSGLTCRTDSPVMRQFVGVDLGQEPEPDETRVCKFRHLLEEHRLGEKILGTVNLHLQARGVRITTGTIVDATILHAPTSTKNREQLRDPEMHQTKKGKQWYFGMKAHVGVDSKTKIIHTAVATPAH